MNGSFAAECSRAEGIIGYAGERKGLWEPAVHRWMSGARVGWDVTVHSQWKVGRQAGGCVVVEAGDGFSLLNEPGTKTIICKGKKGRRTRRCQSVEEVGSCHLGDCHQGNNWQDIG